MAEIPNPPIDHPLTGADGKLTPPWVQWIVRLASIIRGL